MNSPLPLDEAQARLLALAAPLEVAHVPVADALDRFLAEPLLARRTQPPADLSAMDGYALGGTDVSGPWNIIGESAAGHPFPNKVGPGEAVRISTGAILPVGAQTVLLQEDATRDGNRLVLAGSIPAVGRHIRRAGFDFATGQDLLPSGQRITPAVLALAVAAGHATLPVHKKPSIVVIDSGDELASDPTQCAPHQIPASNGPMLEAMLASLPCNVTRIGPVPDDLSKLASALDTADSADLIVTSGGASVGDHDLVRPALEAWGAELAFWKVAMKPGKPIMVAQRESAGCRQLVLGLPGNPVSSYVTAYLFMLPLIRTLLGASRALPVRIFASAGTALAAGGQRQEFIRARWNGHSVSPLTEQDSSALRALSAANALIDRPAGSAAVTAGEEVSLYLLDNGGIA
ncbi:molybdopterin molybdenumtransferase MoeA [Croceicoccus estronivorus]|uniref:molybdopterin molybdotransferase MoeA n=1 Tax=Croceicoccus estronivorus TaxID=1172626 RepID=UPI0008353A70|nr:gephyrin-like molybdotransferase Glp [Croceicoccus estronivorus]OCC23200.1 molybdopterin molybdenumtransferase MoeA [Croceicoccus estronivorus]